MTNILTLAGAQEGTVTKASLEALGAARIIQAAQGGQIHAVLIGANTGDAAAELIAHGADTVWVADDPALAEYQPDPYLAAAQAAARQADAGVVLTVGDDTGRDLAPRLAHRLAAGSVTEVIDIKVDGPEIQWVRPVYGGKAHAVYVALSERQVHALRPKMFAAPAREQGRQGEVNKLGLSLDPATAAARCVEKLQEAVSGVRLEDARVIVAGGRGIGGPEGFADLQRLADVLGAAVGASRVATDAGWVPATQQVGQTGKMVAPDLYIAVGISGASQHLAGVTAAKTVVAINRDVEAPIFKRADLGIVADWKAVFPHLIDKCKEIGGQA